MSTRQKRFACATFLLLIGTTALLTFVWKGSAPASAATMSVPDVRTALLRVGLSPEALTACGVPTGAISGVVAGVKSFLLPNPLLLSTADLELEEATAQVEVLERRIRAGLASEEELAAHAQATSDQASATSHRNAILEDLFEAGVTPLSPAAIQKLETTAGQEKRWRAPLEFLVIARSETDWVRLKQALANERISQKRGEDPDPADRDLLLEARGESDVAAARADLDTRLSAVQAAWEDAVANG